VFFNLTGTASESSGKQNKGMWGTTAEVLPSSGGVDHPKGILYQGVTKHVPLERVSG